MVSEGALAFGSIFGIIMAVCFIIMFVIAIGILAFIFWLLMLIDCIKRKFKDDTEKIVWVLLMVFLGVLASIIYYFVVKIKDKKKSKEKKE